MYSPLLSKFFSQSPVGFSIICGYDFIVEEANDTFCDMLQLKKSEVLNQPLFKAAPLSENLGYKEILTQVLQTGSAFAGKELPAIISKNGVASLFYFNINYELIDNETGTNGKILVLATDITDIVNSKKELEIKEQRLNLALKTSNMGVWDYDLINNNSIRNLRHDEIFGFNEIQPNWTFDDFYQHLLPHEIDNIKKRFKEAYDTGIIKIKFAIKDNQNHTKWVQVKGDVFYDKQKTPVRIVGTIEDITAAVLTEQQLAIQNYINDTITNNATIGLILTDNKGQCDFMNPAALDMFGYEQEEVKNASIHELIHHHYPDGSPYPKDKCPLNNSLPGSKRLMHHEDLFFRKDGSAFPVICNSTPIIEHGVVIKTVMEVRDITAQKELEKKQEETNTALNKLIIQKDELMGIASHELKTPVTAIKAYTQFLFNQFTKIGDHKSAEMLSKMDGQLNKLGNLITNLLDITKINEGELTFNNKQISLHGIIYETVEQVQRTTNKRINLRLNASYDHVLADPIRIEQVIINFLTNAIKYAPLSDVITIETLGSNAEIICKVIDYGNGIKKEKQSEVFKRFYRIIEDDHDRVNGLGLGLYICAHIIARQNGKIWVESDFGKGSSFCFSLPLKN